MKFIKALTLIYFICILKAQAQIHVTIASYGVDNSAWNATGNFVEVQRTGSTTFMTGAMFFRPINFTRPVRIEGIVYLESSKGKWDISDTLKINTNAFSSGRDLSDARFISCSIQADQIANDGTDRLKFKYRYYKDQYPVPEQNDGWTEIMGSPGNSNYKILEVRFTPGPLTKIDGPDVICSDATYTIENAGVVTLEDTWGVATLTHLGNNLYKVNLINAELGSKIVLKSTKDGIETKKLIKAGANESLGTLKTAPGTISGMGSYTLEFVDSEDNFESITSWYVSSPTNSVRIDAGGPKKAYLNVDTWNYTGSNTISVIITGTTVCGKQHTRTVLLKTLGNGGGGSSPFDPDA